MAIFNSYMLNYQEGTGLRLHLDFNWFPRKNEPKKL